MHNFRSRCQTIVSHSTQERNVSWREDGTWNSSALCGAPHNFQTFLPRAGDLLKQRPWTCIHVVRKANRQVRQTRNVEVRVNVCVGFHPLGTNTPQSTSTICPQNIFVSGWKGTLIQESVNEKKNNSWEYTQYFVYPRKPISFDNGVSCSVKFYVYAYIYVSCLPNLANKKFRGGNPDGRGSRGGGGVSGGGGGG